MTGDFTDGRGHPETPRPFFSIGVTTYDRFDLLKETVSSVLWQTFGDFELLIGNDNTDRVIDSSALGISDRRIRYVNHRSNLGCLNNMNTLLGLSRGRYFAWLADDDMLMPAYLESIHDALCNHGFVECVFTSYVVAEKYPGSPVSSDEKARVFIGREWVWQYLSQQAKAVGCSGMIDRSYLQRIGGIRQLGTSWLSPYSDNLIAIEAGLTDKVIYIPRNLVFIRKHETSGSATSTDVDAYSSAQKDLIEMCRVIFDDDRFREDRSANLFMLTRWCWYDYFRVMKRSGRFQAGKLLWYLFSTSISFFHHYRYWYPLMHIATYQLVGLIKQYGLQYKPKGKLCN